MSKIEKYTALICLVLLLWILLSLCDTLAHNLSDYNYASWNAMELFYNTIK